MSEETARTEADAQRDPVPEPLDIDALITNNTTILPEVYAHVSSEGRASPTDISTALQCNRQTVHTNLDRLRSAGLVERSAESTYSLQEPALSPTVVQAVAELGSSLRLDLCEFAVEEGSFVVADARESFEMTGANLRKTANALTDDGYLAKRSSRQNEGLLTYRVTDQGEQALRALADPTEYLRQDGDSVNHYANGIEGTQFQTAYEVEDAYVLSECGESTIAELLDKTDKEEKSTRRRLSRLTDRGLLDVTRHQARNIYRPTPRTRTMVAELHSLDDERRLQAWEQTVPATLRQRLPARFFPEELFQAFDAELHDADPGLADRFISRWKRMGLVEGNRHAGFRFVRADA